ncbi:GyrI-like domain-containing protein [Nocardia sp. NPDC003963]
MRRYRSMDYRVGIDESEPHTVLVLRRAVSSDRARDDIGAGTAELYRLARSLGAAPIGSPRTTYYGLFGPGTTNRAEFELPITLCPGGGTTEEFTIRRTDRQRFAHTSHRGGYGGLADAYRALDRWILAAGLQAVGPPTEVYHVAPDEAVTPAGMVTEIRVPIAAALLTVRTPGPFEKVVEATRKILREYGFDIVGEVGIPEPLGDRPHHGPGVQLLLSVHDPGLAGRALGTTGRIAPLLPCTVALRAEAGSTIVEALDPEQLPPFGDPQISVLQAGELGGRLREILDGVAAVCRADLGQESLDPRHEAALSSDAGPIPARRADDAPYPETSGGERGGP